MLRPVETARTLQAFRPPVATPTSRVVRADGHFKQIEERPRAGLQVPRAPFAASAGQRLSSNAPNLVNLWIATQRLRSLCSRVNGDGIACTPAPLGIAQQNALADEGEDIAGGGIL